MRPRREALGSDMGVAPTTEEEMLAQPNADTVENLTALDAVGAPPSASEGGIITASSIRSRASRPSGSIRR